MVFIYMGIRVIILCCFILTLNMDVMLIATLGMGMLCITMIASCFLKVANFDLLRFRLAKVN